MSAPLMVALERMQADLARRRQAVEVQAAVVDGLLAQVQQGVCAAPCALMLLYVDTGSAKRAAEQAAAMGLLAPGEKGPRRLAPEDVYALIQAPCEGVPAELWAMAREVYRRQGGSTRLQRTSAWRLS